MSAQNTSKRLTANTFTPDFLKEIVMETQGLLGLYEIKEFELLQTIILHLNPPEWDEDEDGNSILLPDYEVRWIPSKSDARAGRVKLQPVSKRGVNTLDAAHAQVIMDRNPLLRRFNAVGFVKNIKRHKDVFHNPKVQDFLLRRHADQELHNLHDDKEHFKAYITANMRDDFSHRQLEAIHNLLPRVHEVMQRTPNAMKQRNAEQQTEASSEQSEETPSETPTNTSSETSAPPEASKENTHEESTAVTEEETVDESVADYS